jgi:hypothetical protein
MDAFVDTKAELLEHIARDWAAINTFAICQMDITCCGLMVLSTTS